jgi:hypothetical protein
LRGGKRIIVYPKIALEDGVFGLFSWFVVAVTCTIWSSHAGLYESPVLSVIEGTGFHPLLSRCAGMVVTNRLANVLYLYQFPLQNAVLLR